MASPMRSLMRIVEGKSYPMPLSEGGFSDDFFASWNAEMERVDALVSQKKASLAGSKVTRSVADKPKGRPVRSGRAQDFLQRVREEAQRMLGVPADEIDPSEVRDWLIHHRSIFHRKRVRVFRILRATESFVTGLNAGTALGQHWSWNFNPHNVEEFNTFDEHESDAPLFVFECEVDIGDVALELTVAYNCVFPREEEVFLGGYSPSPIFKSVHLLNTRHNIEGDNLRPDLVGQIMRA